MTNHQPTPNGNVEEPDETIGPSEGECIACGADLSDKPAGKIGFGEYAEQTDVLHWADGEEKLCWLCIEGVDDFLLQKEKTPEQIREEATPDPSNHQ